MFSIFLVVEMLLFNFYQILTEQIVQKICLEYPPESPPALCAIKDLIYDATFHCTFNNKDLQRVFFVALFTFSIFV